MGALAIPHDFTTEATDSIANFMANWFAIRDYVNLRVPGVGLLANRPGAGHNGAIYLATDVAGGTVYLDDGSVWNVAAAGVSVSIPTFTIPFPYVSPTF